MKYFIIVTLFLGLASNSLLHSQAVKVTDNTMHYSFIAQELREIYPELVFEDSRGLFSAQPLSRSMWEESGRFASAVVDNATEIDGKEVDTKKMILTGD